MKRTSMITVVAISLAVLGTAQEHGHWPHWRGPAATGAAPDPIPVHWSDEENVTWKIELPGRGVATPIIWGERLYLTTSVPTEPDAAAEEAPREAGSEGRGRRGMTPTEQSFEVWCLDRKTGETLWKEVASVATPHECSARRPAVGVPTGGGSLHDL